MKVQFNTLQSMRRDIKVMAEHFGFEGLRESFQFDQSLIAFRLWNHVFLNRAYGSDNPNVIMTHGSRLLRYDEHFQQYPDDTNDDTLKTALLKVCREIFA